MFNKIVVTLEKAAIVPGPVSGTWLVSLIVLSLLLVVLNYNKQETKCFIQLILYHPSVIYI